MIPKTIPCNEGIVEIKILMQNLCKHGYVGWGTSSKIHLWFHFGFMESPGPRGLKRRSPWPTETNSFNTLRPIQDGRHLPDDIFKCIFFSENVSINNIPALVQIMVWRRPGDKPLSEPMMVSSPTHRCVTRPRWVNAIEIKSDLTWSVVNCLLFVGKPLPKADLLSMDHLEQTIS